MQRYMSDLSVTFVTVDPYPNAPHMYKGTFQDWYKEHGLPPSAKVFLLLMWCESYPGCPFGPYDWETILAVPRHQLVGLSTVTGEKIEKGHLRLVAGSMEIVDFTKRVVETGEFKKVAGWHRPLSLTGGGYTVYYRSFLCNENQRPTKLCLACQAVATKRCSVCKTAMYCSQECQRGDWKAHKKVCR